MKIVIPGGTGQVGTLLARAFSHAGHDVVVLSRCPTPATRWMLEVGARLRRTETELILKSRRVVPARLLNSGFAFTFPQWPQAAADLCRRWRRTQGRAPMEAAA